MAFSALAFFLAQEFLPPIIADNPFYGRWKELNIFFVDHGLPATEMSSITVVQYIYYSSFPRTRISGTITLISSLFPGLTN